MTDGNFPGSISRILSCKDSFFFSFKSTPDFQTFWFRPQLLVLISSETFTYMVILKIFDWYNLDSDTLWTTCPLCCSNFTSVFYNWSCWNSTKDEKAITQLLLRNCQHLAVYILIALSTIGKFITDTSWKCS